MFLESSIGPESEVSRAPDGDPGHDQGSELTAGDWNTIAPEGFGCEFPEEPPRLPGHVRP